MRPEQMSRFPATQVRATGDLSIVRNRFGSWLDDVEVDGDRIDDLLVVVSELLANAVRETPDGAEPATFAAWVDDGSISLEVSNVVAEDLVAPDEHDWDLADPLRTGGRGLMLVSAFVDDVDVDVSDDRLVVRCTARR